MLLCENLAFSICSNLNNKHKISLRVAISLNTNVNQARPVPDFLKSLVCGASVCTWIITMDRIRSTVNGDMPKKFYVCIQ